MFSGNRTDTDKYKPYLRTYLERKGRVFKGDRRSPVTNCPNPSNHRTGDSDPSAILYDDSNLLYCPVCEGKWDVFDCAGMLSSAQTFPEKLKEVQDVLGMAGDDVPPAPKHKQLKQEKIQEPPVSVDRERALQIFARRRMLSLFRYGRERKVKHDSAFIAGKWLYTDQAGDTIACDVRFEDTEGHKDVVTFWYNGETLKSRDCPNLIFNLHQLINTSGPILLHEGAKCADIGKDYLLDYVHGAWNGGTHRAKFVDWSPLVERAAAGDVYMFRDNDDPGLRAALDIKEQIPGLKIVNPPEKIREIKGADIEQAVEVYDPNWLSEYILNPDNHYKHREPRPRVEQPINSDLPFADPDYDELAKHPKTEALFDTIGNTAAADLLVMALSGRVIYVEVEKKNYFFNGSRWEECFDMYSIVYVILQEVVSRHYKTLPYEEYTFKQYKKIQRYIHGRRWKNDVLAEFNLKQGIRHRSVPWDSPSIRETMTTLDGVIDFKNGRMEPRQGRPEEYRLKYVPFTTDEIMSAPNAEKFKEFMSQIFPDPDTIETALYSLSLCVSGNSGSKLFHLWTGDGYNGKSTLSETMKAVLGQDKAITYEASMLLDSKLEGGKGAARPDLARFQGAYAAFATETDKNKKFSVALIKQLTGGDSITARRLFQDEITFSPTWQLILAVNDVPSFGADDGAFTDRLLILPFVRRFYKTEEQRQGFLAQGVATDNILPAGDKDKIEAELYGERVSILRYLIEKYIELQTDHAGVVPRSDECTAVKKDYVSENDTFGLFMRECVEVAPGQGYFTPSAELMEAYRDFAGLKSISVSAVTRMIKKADKRVEIGVKRVSRFVSGDGGEYGSKKSKPVKGLFNIRLRETEKETDAERQRELGEDEEMFRVM